MTISCGRMSERGTTTGDLCRLRRHCFCNSKARKRQWIQWMPSLSLSACIHSHCMLQLEVALHGTTYTNLLTLSRDMASALVWIAEAEKTPKREHSEQDICRPNCCLDAGCLHLMLLHYSMIIAASVVAASKCFLITNFLLYREAHRNTTCMRSACVTTHIRSTSSSQR